jgi:3-hydroxybutyryl-CoA dehydrogenase
MTPSSIAIVGAGTMGRGIAQVAATAGMKVTIIDVNAATVEAGRAAIVRNLDGLVARGKLTAGQRDLAAGRILTSLSYAALVAADVVVEAASENFELKRKILQQIDAVARPTTVIATNTSSFSITKLAASVSQPDRFIGLHFFNPVPAMALVEIVRGLRTSEATYEFAEELIAKLGKSSITVAKSSPGFVVNRILLPMLNEAFFVLAEGDAEATDIDAGMKLGCNHPIGPLALADLIGLDVLLVVMETLHDEFADSKYRPAPLLKELVAAGYLGRKSGRGVYRYGNQPLASAAAAPA